MPTDYSAYYQRQTQLAPLRALLTAQLHPAVADAVMFHLSDVLGEFVGLQSRLQEMLVSPPADDVAVVQALTAWFVHLDAGSTIHLLYHADQALALLPAPAGEMAVVPPDRDRTVLSESTASYQQLWEQLYAPLSRMRGPLFADEIFQCLAMVLTDLVHLQQDISLLTSLSAAIDRRLADWFMALRSVRVPHWQALATAACTYLDSSYHVRQQLAELPAGLQPLLDQSAGYDVAAVLADLFTDFRQVQDQALAIMAQAADQPLLADQLIAQFDGLLSTLITDRFLAWQAEASAARALLAHPSRQSSAAQEAE